ncbi:MAG: DUF4390 domain-containing protein [Wenzhouxiangella sp.]|jgi:hypothetical protein|nr:DUF4390 domain-containing protein [Wenzhouxiangella sp.]
MVSIIWLLSACAADPDVHGHLRLIDPEPRWQDNVLGIDAGIDFEPGPQVIEALEHGVTVHIRFLARIGPAWRRSPITDDPRSHRFEIRYLPLIRHYELTDLRSGERTSYPRLHMVRDALAQPRWMETRLRDRSSHGPGWRLQARVEIDRTRLPSPMRLPVWFDPNWGLGDDWQTWTPEEYGVP